MKILYISPDPGINADEDCGAGSHIQETIRALRGLGHEVRLLAPDFNTMPPSVSGSLAGDCCGADLRSGQNVRVPRHLWFSRITRAAQAVKAFLSSSSPVSAADHNPLDIPAGKPVVKAAPTPNSETATGNADPGTPGLSASPSAESQNTTSSGGPLSRLRQSASGFFYGPFRHHLHLWEEQVIYRKRFFRAAMAMIRDWQPDGVLERYALEHFAVTNWCRKNRLPHVLEVNALLARESGKSEQARSAERRFLASAPFVLTVSDALRDEIRNPHILVNPNGVDIDRFCPAMTDPRISARAERLCLHYGLGEGPVIGWIGGFGPNRGLEQSLDIAISACAARPDLQFMIMGDGPLMEEARRIVQDSGFGHAIHLTGRITKDRVPNHLALLDMALAPYPADGAAYFSPLKIFEYMAMGLPTLATDAGQSRMLLSDDAGCLLPAEKPEEWTAAILDLADHPARRQEMGRRARDRVAGEYTWEANARRILKAFASRKP